MTEENYSKSLEAGGDSPGGFSTKNKSQAILRVKSISCGVKAAVASAIRALKLPLLAGAALFCGALSQALDNGDGTYSNPMIHADHPDCEIIRVGDDYYYLTSSFHLIPANPIMHSKDLVNWECIGHTIPKYDFGDKRYDMEGGSRYGAGSWAPTLRYHKGMFYSACFVWDRENYKDTEGYFLVSRTKDPTKEWKTNIIADEKLYDPGLFFDDDGRVYVVHGQHNLFVSELDKDLTKVIGKARPIFKGDGMLEGSHMYKINGMYYIYATRWGTAVCLRSKDIYGPYEFKQLLISDINFPNSTLHQGGLVQTKSGEWWTVIFQDRGKHGRLPFLLPVEWKDGWPYPKSVWTYKKPDIKLAKKAAFKDWRSDDFDSPELGKQWQWNHHPDNDSWSLTERKGYLRLRTVLPNVTYLRNAKNTLTQPVLGPDSGFCAKFDVSNMKDGDFAGIGFFSSDPMTIAVAQTDGKRRIVLVEEAAKGWAPDVKNELDSAELKKNDVWLKVKQNYLEYASEFFYSYDGRNFAQLGGKRGVSYNFFADWLGPRYCVYNYTTKEPGGYVDVDEVKYIYPERKDNLYKFGDVADLQFCDKTSEILHAFEWIDFAGLKNVYFKYPDCGPICGGKFHEPVTWANALVAKDREVWGQFNRVEFKKAAPEIEIFAKGRGKVFIKRGEADGETLAEFDVDSKDFANLSKKSLATKTGVGKVTAVLIPESGSKLLLKSFRLK